MLYSLHAEMTFHLFLFFLLLCKTVAIRKPKLLLSLFLLDSATLEPSILEQVLLPWTDMPLRAFVAIDSSFRPSIVMYACLSQPGLQNDIISWENKTCAVSPRPSVIGLQLQRGRRMRQEDSSSKLSWATGVQAQPVQLCETLSQNQKPSHD